MGQALLAGPRSLLKELINGMHRMESGGASVSENCLTTAGQESAPICVGEGLVFEIEGPRIIRPLVFLRRGPMILRNSHIDVRRELHVLSRLGYSCWEPESASCLGLQVREFWGLCATSVKP